MVDRSTPIKYGSAENGNWAGRGDSELTSKDYVIVLHNAVAPGCPKDELDVLDQVNAVSLALEQLGFGVHTLAFSEDLGNLFEGIQRIKPLFVFNLVEAVSGQAKLSYLAPAILESWGVRYSGCSAESILLTTNKIVTKKLLQERRILTPSWITVGEYNGFMPNEDYIIKAVYEDGSVGLHQGSVIRPSSIADVQSSLIVEEQKVGRELFVERYIEGREIYVSLLGEKKAPSVLTPCEIKFVGYEEKQFSRIVDYRAKWEKGTFEYTHAIPKDHFSDEDASLIGQLRQISLRCWHEFGLQGYARVDFRVDGDGVPWVLEINANPCITPGESSFIRSASNTGLDFVGTIRGIISGL